MAAARPVHDEHKGAMELKLTNATEQAARLRFRITTGVRAVGTAMFAPGATLMLTNVGSSVQAHFNYVLPFVVPGSYLWLMLLLPTRPREVRNLSIALGTVYTFGSLGFINQLRDPASSHSSSTVYNIIVVSTFLL